MQYMFGVPYYCSTIDPTAYNKSEILADITENYNKNSFRNRWDTQSNLHHSYNDKDNINFKAIDYQQLLPLYTQQITNFLNEYSESKISFRYDIENYTCMTKGQFMREHDHPSSDFTAVHYIKYNPDVHKPTTYVNPAHWALYNDRIVSPKMNKISNSNFFKHSWYWSTVNLNVVEDNFVITPSPLKHRVELQNSDELRVVIVLNIHIE